MAGALQGHSHQHLSAIGEPARPLAALGAHYVLDDSPPSPLDLRAAMDIRGLSRERTGSRAPDIYRRAICERPHRSGNEERVELGNRSGGSGPRANSILLLTSALSSHCTSAQAARPIFPFARGPPTGAQAFSCSWGPPAGRVVQTPVH